MTTGARRGSAWASCIDIGGKYTGIVSGCMNTIGNLGGAVAGYASGWVVDAYKDTPTPHMGWTINFYPLINPPTADLRKHIPDESGA